MHLESLGADSRVCAQWSPYEQAGLELARVAMAHRGRCRIYTEQGEADAEASGALLFRCDTPAGLPVVGDWVAVRRINPEEALIEAVLPRRTKFSRRAAGDRDAEQVIAANIDIVFLVCGLDGDWNPRRLERFLTLAHESGADPVVVLNKTDICPDLPARLREAAAIARTAAVVATSARSAGGLTALDPFLGGGRTVALLGSSGAGKSTILNGLLGHERARTGAVRESDSRGRHTTTFRELVALPQGGAVIDTPGLREVQLWAGLASLDRAFDEVSALAARCRFRDCGHETEPGCAVREAIEEGRLPDTRLLSYRKLRKEVEWRKRLDNPLEAQAEKQRWKRIHKAHRRGKPRPLDSA
ncbi:MAG: ribosome small subunit-dependent GTPase A [Bryobacteraceae bacterium]